MSTTTPERPDAPSSPHAPRRSGPIGRLGPLGRHQQPQGVHRVGGPRRRAWGSSPRAWSTRSSGAGWQANGSESVQVRDLVQARVRRAQQHGADGRRAQPRPDNRRRPRSGRPSRTSPPRSRPTTASRPSALPQAGTDDLARRPHRDRDGGRRRRQPTRWSAPPTTSRGPLTALGGADVQVALTGASGMWSDFNEANRERDVAVGAVQLAGDAGHPRARVRLAGRRRPAAAADDPRAGRLGRLAVPAHASSRRSRSGR